MLWAIPLTPLVVGVLVWGLDRTVDLSRGLLGAVAVATFGLTMGLVAWGWSIGATATFAWGAGLELRLETTPLVGAMALLVPAIALPVGLWASAHEPRDGLGRLIGLIVGFVGAMELLVLAADLLVLIVGWELVSAFSWVLIAHELGDTNARDAAYGFNASRLGGLGLFVAAGAALASTGSFAFANLSEVATSPWGGVFAAGLLAAAASKSAQLPFSPWLFRAMSGPSSVSALLHSSTMVAAGAWLVIRLRAYLSRIGWFDEVAVGLGLATAVAGGLVASAQPHAKRLLAASTSAHYGFVFAAAGAGAAGAGFAHLVAHAAFKSLLFLAAGTAIGVAGHPRLRDMRLGRLVPVTAAASAVGALGLAGIPPLGGAWTKEKVVAALGRTSPALALVAIGATALSAWYAGRFYFLAFGRGSRDARPEGAEWPGLAEQTGMGLLAAASLLLGLLWLPDVSTTVGDLLGITWPHSPTWEIVAGIAAPVLAALGAWVVFGSERTESKVRTRTRRAVADWLALPTLLDRLLVRPTLWLADVCANFDDCVVDAGVRAAERIGRTISRLADRFLEASVEGVVAFLAAAGRRTAGASRITDDTFVDGLVETTGSSVGRAAHPARETQTGQIPRYYVYVAGGLFVLVLLALIWR
ncbi:MAG: proton-conducting transporter membrane subunit [Bradymonadaceae bacterium]